MDNTSTNQLANILEVYSQQNVYDIHIILMTGREEKYRPQTERWLELHQIRYEALYMRKTGDSRIDTVVKKELFIVNLAQKFDVLFVLEDRAQGVAMWRKEWGLTCFQVEWGNF